MSDAIKSILARKLSSSNPPYESASQEPDYNMPGKAEEEENGMEHSARGMIEALHSKDHKAFSEHLSSYLDMYEPPAEEE